MRKLTKIIASALIATATIGGAGAASAQPYPGHDQGNYRDDYRGDHRGDYRDDHRTPARAQAIRHQIDELQRRIDRNDWRGRISDREARSLRNDVARLQMQFRTYNRDGLNNQEMRFLQSRIDNIRTRLHIERRDWNNRAW